MFLSLVLAFLPLSYAAKWELGRFLKTAAFYDAVLPRIPFFAKKLSSERNFIKDKIIWSNEKRNGIEWGPLDDVVMGGISRSNLEPGQSFDGNWTGIVTTENNGGFAGIRTKLFQTPYNLSTSTGLILNCLGDGKRYKFIARDDAEWNGIAWSYSFDTNAGKPIKVTIPFDKLLPTKFARSVNIGRKFDKSQLAGIQLSLSKFEYDGALNPKFAEGPFALKILSIEKY
jgi:hypothetical protein